MRFLSTDSILRDSKRVAPSIAGMARIKENSADFSLLIPESIPVDIVAPEREMPGTKATVCIMPMAMDCRGVTLVVFSLVKRVRKSRKPVTIKAPDTSLVFENEDSRRSLTKKPPIAIGILPKMILARYLGECRISFILSLNTTRITAKDAKWSRTLKRRGVSWMFAIFSYRARCPELLMGNHSVIPWITPRFTASIMDIAFVVY